MHSKISSHLAIPLLCLVLSLAALTSHALKEGNYTYTVNDGKAIITGFNMSYSGPLLITNTLGGYPVISIQEGGFGHCEGLTVVTIPDGITSLGSYVFDGCFAMTSVSIPNSVTSISHNVFQYCQKLTSITIPSSVTSMGGSIFSDCPLLTGIFFKGNAPKFTGGSINTSDNAPVYYLPGTTNWSETFIYFHPTFCWNPTVQTDSTFGFNTNRFGFKIVGTANIPVVVEATTNLSSGVWTSLTNTTLGDSGSLYFSDPSSTNKPARFYRIVWP